MAIKTECDICGKEDCDLILLKSEYQIDNRMEICSDCHGYLNKALNGIRKAHDIQITNWMRDLIREFANKFTKVRLN